MVSMCALSLLLVWFPAAELGAQSEAHLPAPITSGSEHGQAGVPFASKLTLSGRPEQSKVSARSAHCRSVVKGERVLKPKVRVLSGSRCSESRAGWLRSEMYLHAFGLSMNARS